MSKTIKDMLDEQRNPTKEEKISEAIKPKKATYQENGRTFETYVFNTDAEANSFIGKSEGKFGVIGLEGKKVHVARMKDEGTKNNKQTADGKVK